MSPRLWRVIIAARPAKTPPLTRATGCSAAPVAFTKFARRTKHAIYSARASRRASRPAAAPSDAFCCSAPWWELSAGTIARRRRGRDEEAAHARRLLRGALFGEQRSARADPRRRGGSRSSAWGRILGQIRQNAICVELQNPVAEVLPALSRVARAGFGGAAIADVLRAHAPPRRAAGAPARHRCRSWRARITTASPTRRCTSVERAAAVVVATRAIAEGEAVTISYIDGNARDGVEARRRARRVRLRVRVDAREGGGGAGGCGVENSL